MTENDLVNTHLKFRFDPKYQTVTEKTFRTDIRDALSYIRKALPPEIYNEVLASQKKLPFFLHRIAPAIIEKLKSDVALAESKTSDSWRKLRTAVARLYGATGLIQIADNIKKIKNPAELNNRNKKPRASRRQKSIHKSNLNQLIIERTDAGDLDSVTLLILGWSLGIRPCEVKNISWKQAQKAGYIEVTIGAAKSTVVGQRYVKLSRGIDRTLTIETDPFLITSIDYWNKTSNDGNIEKRIKNASERVSNAAKKLWPNQRKNFTLYSLRDIFGSRVKFRFQDEKQGRVIVAALMGHKCTKSARSYGNSATGKSMVEKSKCNAPQPSNETVAKVIDNRSSLEKLNTDLARYERLNHREHLEILHDNRLSPENRLSRFEKLFERRINGYHKWPEKDR